MSIGLPKVTVSFEQEGMTAIKRGSKGVVAMILKETVKNNFTVFDTRDIPSEISAENKKFIELCLIGNTEKPSKIEVYVLAVNGQVSEALNYFEDLDFNYLTFPKAIAADNTTIKDWIVDMRSKYKMCKAVLTGSSFNNEGIINFTTTNIVVNEKTYQANEYCARIAGLLAGTDLRQSATHAILDEVENIPYLTKSAIETKIAQGELVLYKQYGKIKIARAVTSLTTCNDKPSKLKKIKISDISDLAIGDIVKVSNENYIGKLANNYDSKCLLLVGIANYFANLAKDTLIENKYIVELDLEAQRDYIKAQGIDITKLNENEIKEFNTGDKVFISIKITILDAVEEIDIKFAI